MSMFSVRKLFVRQPTYSKLGGDLDHTNCDIERYVDDDSYNSDAASNSDASTLLHTATDASPGTGDNNNRRSFINARVVSDAIIGLSDGLTVPFALTAGLSALGNTRVVIFGGLAELTAGAISMGLGGYLAARSEEQSYNAVRNEVEESTAKDSDQVKNAVDEVFEPYQVPEDTLDSLSMHIQKSPKLVDFLMHFQQRAEEPAPSRAVTCALTIAMCYFLGGFLPLMPYFFVNKDDIDLALWISVAVMAAALLMFGYGKTVYVSGAKGSVRVREGVVGGVQMMLVGGLAAGCAMGLVKAFDMLAGLHDP